MKTEEHSIAHPDIAHPAIPKLPRTRGKKKTSRSFDRLRLYYHTMLYTETDSTRLEAYMLIHTKLPHYNGRIHVLRDKIQQEIQGYEYWLEYDHDPINAERYKRMLSVYYDFMARTERS